MKKQNTPKKAMNPIAATIAGVVIGAGVAVAGAVALSDKKNQKKVKKLILDVKGTTQGYIEDMKTKVGKGKVELKKDMKEVKEKIKKEVKSL